MGVGLIGGSIGMGLRARGWHVHGVDTDGDHLARAVALDAVDATGWDPGAELTFVATPVGYLVEAIKQLASLDEVQDLRDELAVSHAENAVLQERLSSLEARMERMEERQIASR